MIDSEIFVKRHCSHPLTPVPLIRRAHERGQQAVISALLAHMNVVTLTQHAAEVDDSLLNHVQQINAPVTASMLRELFTLHLSNPERVTADDEVLAGLSPPSTIPGWPIFLHSIPAASRARTGRGTTPFTVSKRLPW
jgi:hypothetical protein